MILAIDDLNTTNLAWDLSAPNQALSDSIKQHGILAPILCYKLNNQYYVCDGRQRIHAAKKHNIQHVNCTIIPNNRPIEPLIHALHQKKINQSTLLKLQFINQFGLALTRETIHPFGLSYYAHIKKDIQRICARSLPFRRFLHDKGYSLKEICHLIHYSTDYVEQCINAQQKIAFSKRSFDQTIANGCELMKRYSWSLDELNQHINFHAIIQSDQTPQQNQTELTKKINAHLHPVLNQRQQVITACVNDFHNQTGLHIQYDASLEHKEIQLTATISSEADLMHARHILNTAEVQSQLYNILEKL